MDQAGPGSPQTFAAGKPYWPRNHPTPLNRQVELPANRPPSLFAPPRNHALRQYKPDPTFLTRSAPAQKPHANTREPVSDAAARSDRSLRAYPRNNQLPCDKMELHLRREQTVKFHRLRSPRLQDGPGGPLDLWSDPGTPRSRGN